MPQNCLARRPHQPLLPPPPRLSPKTYIRTHARIHPCTQDEAKWAFSVLAPAKLPVKEGDELFNWYGGAGAGASTPEARAAGEAEFLVQYGFSPWE